MGSEISDGLKRKYNDLIRAIYINHNLISLHIASLLALMDEAGPSSILLNLIHNLFR